MKLHPEHMILPDSSQQYVVVFDAAEAGYRYWYVPALFSILLLVIGGVLAHDTKRFRRMAGVVGLVAAPMMGLLIFYATYSNYARIRDALRSGDFVIVEGVVEDFRPGNHNIEEQFTITSGGRNFSYAYSPSRLKGGFDLTFAQHGPVRPGIRVRIADIDGIIGRLEVERGALRERTHIVFP